jgi:hypothetical protein
MENTVNAADHAATMVSISHSLGTVHGKIEALIATVAQMQTDSSASRAAVHTDLNALVRKVDALERSVATMQPTVGRMEALRFMGKGALMVVSVMAAGVGSGVTLLWKTLAGSP